MYHGPGYQNMISHATCEEMPAKLDAALRFANATPADAWIVRLRQTDPYDYSRGFGCHFEIHWSSYRGWRVYMFMTGCLASDPTFERENPTLV